MFSRGLRQPYAGFDLCRCVLLLCAEWDMRLCGCHTCPFQVRDRHRGVANRFKTVWRFRHMHRSIVPSPPVWAYVIEFVRRFKYFSIFFTSSSNLSEPRVSPRCKTIVLNFFRHFSGGSRQPFSGKYPYILISISCSAPNRRLDTCRHLLVNRVERFNPS